MAPFNLSREIETEAKNLGFSLVGFTPPATPPHFEVFRLWASKIAVGGLEYLSRDDAVLRRQYPSTNINNCQTVIVLGFPYPGPLSITQPVDAYLHGRIASYAWGMDYHKIFIRQSEKLIQRIQSRYSNCSFKTYVDTGPILERDLGQMAGLGWIGKNTCLISPQKGSYFFLGEIFTDLAIEPTQPFEHDYCGSCRKCIDICPTQCIQLDRTLDVGRCISYLTIENKQEIPSDMRPQLGSWVFGCDLCQLICPWNRRHNAQPGSDLLSSNSNAAFPNLVEELKLTPAMFEERFHLSPIRRARRSGYLRNLATALGNQSHLIPSDVILALIDRESDSLVRRHLYWALAQSQPDQKNHYLNILLRKEEDIQAINELIKLLAE